MTVPVIIAPRAQGQIHRIHPCWYQNRPAAPNWFALDLVDAVEQLKIARDAVHVIEAELDAAQRERRGALASVDDAVHDFPRPFLVRVGAGLLSCFAVASNAASIMRGFASCSA